VRVELFADDREVVPGAPVHLGLRLVIEPGWHVYWSNPGDAGLSTAVDLELPAGLEAGEQMWPTPITFSQPGGIVGYGYEHEVVLARPVAASTSLRTPAAFTAEASWLACKDRCILGGATIEGRLPLTEAQVASADRIAQWRQSLPGPCADTQPGFTVTPGAADGDGRFTTWLSWREAPADVELFPDALEGVTFQKARAATRGGLSRLDLELRSTRAEPLTTIRAIIVTTDPDGRRQGCHIELPVDG
jgi:DsbC/DsbD-like thiol-disulfide interchange protein